MNYYRPIVSYGKDKPENAMSVAGGNSWFSEVEKLSRTEASKIIKIESQIYVERSSQKGILIGHKGNNLKIIGTKARTDLEQFFQKKVFIDLKVKVLKNWKSDDKHLKRFGYDLG